MNSAQFDGTSCLCRHSIAFRILLGPLDLGRLKLSPRSPVRLRIVWCNDMGGSLGKRHLALIPICLKLQPSCDSRCINFRPCRSRTQQAVLPIASRPCAQVSMGTSNLADRSSPDVASRLTGGVGVDGTCVGIYVGLPPPSGRALSEASERTWHDPSGFCMSLPFLDCALHRSCAQPCRWSLRSWALAGLDGLASCICSCPSAGSLRVSHIVGLAHAALSSMCGNASPMHSAFGRCVARDVLAQVSQTLDVTASHCDNNAVCARGALATTPLRVESCNVALLTCLMDGSSQRIGGCPGIEVKLNVVRQIAKPRSAFVGPIMAPNGTCSS